MSTPSTRVSSSAVSSSDVRFRRQAITDHFLTALEDVVWRYRA